MSGVKQSGALSAPTVVQSAEEETVTMTMRKVKYKLLLSADLESD